MGREASGIEEGAGILEMVVLASCCSPGVVDDPSLSAVLTWEVDVEPALGRTSLGKIADMSLLRAAVLASLWYRP